MKTNAYTKTAILLHWIVATLIISLLALGWYMGLLEGTPERRPLVLIHKSVGLIAMAFILIRLFWRFSHKPAPLPNTLPQWEVLTAKIGHWSLYTLMLAMPLVGIFGALLSKNDMLFFSWTLPRLLSPAPELAEFFYGVHSVIAWPLSALVILHILAAFKHLIMNRDRVFQRMTTFSGSTPMQ